MMAFVVVFLVDAIHFKCKTSHHKKQCAAMMLYLLHFFKSFWLLPVFHFATAIIINVLLHEFNNALKNSTVVTIINQTDNLITLIEMTTKIL